MSGRIQKRPEGVTASSAWPYAVMPAKVKQPGRKPGQWVLAISIDPDLNGLVTYYPSGNGAQTLHIDNGTWGGKRISMKPFWRVGTKEEAEKFAVTFCSQGYGRSEKLLPHQDGTFWGFNWSSLTMATVNVATRIAESFFGDRYNEAWAIGRAFEETLLAAERAAYENGTLK